MIFRFSRTSERYLSTVDERLQAIARRAIQISKIDFGIPEFGGLRTAEEQNVLYSRGSSQLDGYNKRSYHQTGKALDVFAYVDGRASWEREHMAMVACAMLQAANDLGYKLKWGGLWSSFVDMPHFELED